MEICLRGEAMQMRREAGINMVIELLVVSLRRLGRGWLLFCFFQAEDGIRDDLVTGVQTCALPISGRPYHRAKVPGLPLCPPQALARMAGPRTPRPSPAMRSTGRAPVPSSARQCVPRTAESFRACRAVRVVPAR